jgi:phosphonate transport system substrate-binding protein
MKKARLPQLVFAAMMVMVLLVAACAPTTPAAQPTPVPEQPTTAPTQPPTATSPPAATAAPTDAPEPTDVPEPTQAPSTLGTPADPIIMAIAPSATTDTLIASGDTIAQLLEAETGLSIRAVVPTNYKAMIEAMCAGNAQVGWLPPFAYLVANQTLVTDPATNQQVPCANVAFITLRNQLDHYATQFVGRADLFEEGTELESVQQLNGYKPCWTDQFSASGYVIPASLLAAEGVSTRAPAFVQGHPTVIRAVYAGGICDFGATFVDARSDSGIQADLPDVREKVVVVYQTENIIPNDTVGYAWDLPEDLRDTITAAMAKIATTEEGAAALRTLYSIDGLREADDEFFDEFRVLLAASGIDIAALVR